jgi:site-specific DNA recombinase
VLVLKLDRAFRSVMDTANTMDNLQHHKVGFVSITQDFDTTSSSGRLMLNLLAAFAEFERDMISERVKEGMARAKAEGKHVGRPRKNGLLKAKV